MGLDSANASNRVRPGAPGAAAGTAGYLIKFTFTSSDSGLQVLRPTGTTAQYISVKTTAAVHVSFGDGLIAAVTNANAFLLEPQDGIQDWMLLPADTSFRVKGDTAGGDLYISFSGGA